MMQIINNTGAIIKEQINLGNIDSLNIDDLFKNNTSKKMKNNDYPNWLVPIEIAEKLKGLNFNLKCYFYREEGRKGEDLIKSPFSLSNEVLRNYNKSYYDTSTSLPTWEQVFEWFRSKGYHGIIAAKGEDGENEYSYCIDYLNELSSDFEQDSHLTYEEAREALVKALIQTYKNEQL